jgi:hypothetical protein
MPQKSMQTVHEDWYQMPKNYFYHLYFYEHAYIEGLYNLKWSDLCDRFHYDTRHVTSHYGATVRE